LRECWRNFGGNFRVAQPKAPHRERLELSITGVPVGQSQFSALLELEPKSDRIQSALAYAKRNLDKKLTVGQLAEAAHLSPRQFSRAFRAETRQSPAKAVENLRVEAARLMMEQSRHPIDVVAQQTGFGDRARMRRAFLRAFGQPPQVIRRNARAQMAA
jgi:transcriptional regulator GlxA family with amidase domain